MKQWAQHLEVKMREFYLVNGKGNQYSLMDLSHWLWKPDNLGAKFGSKYEQYDSTFVRTQRIAKPDDIKGTILFTGQDKYGEYAKFVRFLASEPLTLVYKSDGEYKCNVDIKSIDKSEIDAKTSTLQCSIKFKRLSRWYKHVVLDNTGDEARTGKKYDYQYDYTYSEYESQTATIQSDSGYDSPVKITILGPAENPRWSHYVDNKLVGTGSVTANIRDGRRLVIDCTTIPYSIKEFDNNGNVMNDLYQFSDFETQRFFQLQYGKNRIYVEHNGTNFLKLKVEARIEYETI